MDTEQQAQQRPMPGPGNTRPDGADSTPQGSDESAPEGGAEPAPGSSDIPEPKEDGDGKIALDRTDESQDFVDQSKIDFDPDDGLYSGTAVDGTSEIPGPHAEDGDEQSVIEQAKEMAGDDPPESEGQVGTMMRSQSKKDEQSDSDDESAKDDRTPDSSDEQAYN